MERVVGWWRGLGVCRLLACWGCYGAWLVVKGGGFIGVIGGKREGSSFGVGRERYLVLVVLANGFEEGSHSR